MLKKKRIGLFTLLLATGFVSVGEASAGRGAEALPDSETEAEAADNGAAVEACTAGRPNCVVQPYWICVHDGDRTPGACDPDVPGTKCTIPEIPGRPDTGDPERRA